MMQKILTTLRKQGQYLGGASLALIPDLNNRVTQVATCNKTNNSGNVDLVNCTLDKISSQASGIFFGLLGAMAVILLLWSGIQYIQARGDMDKVKAARQRIVNVVIAVILLVGAYTVVNLLIAAASYVASFAN